MPLVAVNLPHALMAGIKTLIDSGKYLSLESFIEVAAFNQLALEKSEAGNALTHEVASTSSAEGAKKSASPPKRRASTGRIPRQVYVLDKPNSVEDFGAGVRSFAKVVSREGAPRPVSVIGGGAEDARIFGQVNRLLPLKLVCRWVMKNAQSQNQWPLLPEISEALADDAARLGSLLEQQDIAKERKRDECLATGLPRRANGPSKDRFVSQFIARVTRGGHVFPGAVCQYKLASIQGQNLVLAPQGVNFAILENPILDATFSASDTALNEEEIKFLVHHVAASVPQEQADIQAVLTAIGTGASTPQPLISALRSYLPQDWNEGDIQTHVSGLIARMSELNLLRRRWHGRHVEYEIAKEQAQSGGKSREAS